MRDPALDHTTESFARFRISTKIHSHRVSIGLRPIRPGVVVIHHVHLAESLRLKHDHQRRSVEIVLRLMLRLDDFRISKQQCSVMKRGLLTAVEQLRGTQHVRIVAAF